MVLQQERPVVPERHLVRKPFWVRWDFWSFFVAAVVILSMLVLVLNAGDTDRTHEMMPEYEVDTLTDPEVAARMGGVIVPAQHYVGSSDANFDPDPGLWWMPEYEVDTLANPAVAALAGGPVTDAFQYVGSDANLDPDPAPWWMPEYEVDTLADPEVAGVIGEAFEPVHRYVGSSDADFDLDVD